MPPLSFPTFLANLATLWHPYPMHIRGIVVIALSILAATARAAIDPNSGIDFVTVGAVNNPAWTGPNSYNNGRGSVGYEYNIARFEVTTTQWVEFLSAAFDRPSNDQIPFVTRPSVFSAHQTPGVNGGIRWTVPAGTEMRGVGGITWHTAAIYCNWLCNGKATNREAFLSGAYDVSTFGYVPGIGYTDQITRSPGAQYWIPSLDEWLKAAHYDPNKANADGTTGGWWTYSNGTNTPLRYAPPGLFDPQGNPSQANASFVGPSNPYLIPLGSYPDTTSPFGLLDVAGMTSEWTEEPYVMLGTTTGRISDGSAWGVYAGTNGVMDNIAAYVGTPAPDTVNAIYGLRIASSVPTPSSLALCIAGVAFASRRRRAVAGVATLALAAPMVARAAIDPNSGIDFVTIGAINNSAWTGGGSNNNRGSVGYEYNIGKFEVTTAQWLEFMNAAFDRPASDAIPFISRPGWTALLTTPQNPGQFRWSIQPGQENLPVGGITWRTAAIYANWLHNGKATNREAFLSGAYDVSTFGTGPNGVGFTDQLTHSPGARYWIPSLDEWMKAAHYDPAKSNADGTIGGWWQYSTTSDSPILYGPAGQFSPGGSPFQANGVWTSEAFPGFNPFSIPLGAYPDVVSPWGLNDVAGGTSEWTEGFGLSPGEQYPRSRFADGSAWAYLNLAADSVSSRGGSGSPNATDYNFGFRIASSVPAPGALFLGVLSLSVTVKRKRNHHHEGRPYPHRDHRFGIELSGE